MSHLGSISLEVELDDRTVEAEVPPLEAAFIELFSEQGKLNMTLHVYCLTDQFYADTWTVPDLIAKIGAIERPAALKALATWVELGVLKEDTPDCYRLLKVAEAAGTTSRAAKKHTTAAVNDLPPVVTVQQQQAEQTRIYWKVGCPFYVDSKCSRIHTV